MLRVLGFATLALLSIGACSSESAPNTVGGGGTGGSSGDSGTGGGGKACDTDADCETDEYCGVGKSCVREGKCGGDGDCTAPQTCGAGSATCLAPGSCGHDLDCSNEEECDAVTQKCVPGEGCGKVEFELTALPPNVMILLDRSGSMGSSAGGDSRWNVAKSAIASVTTAFDAQIRFGLATYSACLPGGCSAGTIVVPIANDNASSINGFLDTTVDQGSSNGQGTSGGKIQYLCDSGDPETSTGKSLEALVGESTLADPLRTNAVILLTDGAETSQCVDSCDGPCGAQSLLQHNPPVSTYVIGLGVNASSVDAIAQAGGTTQSLPATNQTELTNAFNQIAAAVASCEYLLGAAPPDADKLYVYFNDDPNEIANDPNNGWSFDPVTNKLTFNGAACDQIKAGGVNDIDVVYGCPGPVVR